MTVCINEGIRFYKIRQKSMRNGIDRAYWTEKTISSGMGECYQNFYGGMLPCYLADVVDTCICTDEQVFIDTHRKELYSYLLDKDSPYGWLSPQAEFYGVDYTKHKEVAELYFGKQEIELEKEGWIKVFSEFETREPAYASIHPNYEQLDWLHRNGVKYSKYGCGI